MTEYKTILYEKSENGVLKITLNRPDKLNTLNTFMRNDLDHALTHASTDSSIRVIILTGAGRAFCAGADIEQFLSGELGRDAAGGVVMRHMIRTMENCPQPVIASVNGFALGGGLEMTLACDLRVASEAAEFGLTESNLGAIPGAGGTQRLPRVVGVAKAKEMIFLGMRITAKEAERIGLVHRCVPASELESQTNEIANQLLQKAPLSLAAAKSAINKVWEFTSLDSGLMWERDLANLCAESQDRQEGMSAFLEKRKPSFVGR
ncbi:MAG: enoyl-CoA hydratase/isomerase family protein [Nitrososphaerota archaeon]|nr:enoyl-CoA hydratase/isomerase family protein [Nitrososphaerota archaeon]MDG6923014.1 enoyl-CoA hydratase/isomerase family protein [Nitrososphaerota archaeon]